MYNQTEVTLNLMGNYNDENNFPHKILLTDIQASKIRVTFANGSQANFKLSKIVQLGEVLRDIPIFRNILSRVAKKGTDLARDLGKFFLDKQRSYNRFRNTSNKQ